MNQQLTSQKIISASLLRLRMRSPFFATLALFAKFIPTESMPTAATDGKDIFYNPDFLQSLTTPQQDGLILHEVLHAALLHVLRRGVRDKEAWNIAADIVVNGIICQQGYFKLPEGVIRDRNLEHLSVEEIYELLPQQDRKSIVWVFAIYLAMYQQTVGAKGFRPIDRPILKIAFQKLKKRN